MFDSEAGSVRFGNGVKGAIPPLDARVRAAVVRAGGGGAGNLPPGALRKLKEPTDVTGKRVARPLKVLQGLATGGGQDAETLVEAEQRIPSTLRHANRAVTVEDFQRLAAETPGIALGRVEVLPRFKPQQRRENVPGVVSVMVLPFKEVRVAPSPRAGRPFLEAVHAYLDARRPLSTELYTIGCEYVPIAVSVGVDLKDGAQREEVLLAVRDALRRFLWALPPGGPDGSGWPLRRPIRDRELEVVVAQVPGISEVRGVKLFQRDAAGSRWALVTSTSANGAFAIALDSWQLPELLAVLVLDGADAPSDPERLPNPFIDAGTTGVGIPLKLEVC
jgi:predicted phage baseplate assembly protein